ncbi:hypothetical protein ASPZODRAFT_131964 [Penicilliopsis zonata CBS 506.65]|uniref:Cellular morphogenesis protein n=1 Tax=Penicilliopsis zonata CBS 506.65 TaxID=1073090 RepID=A0A1L9SIU7_9EURO|nr:hypothetical protein ASPZODRAFT_131964 [Penicilliopsis zonata CBS 506.65]OJJ47036.1 hypothetical protein ASPZODRAFT_131964 [Penicilliopsis zonata CBS 506.65]
MRIPSLFGPATAGFASLLEILTYLSIAGSPTVHAFSFTSVSHPDLDLSSLGRVGLVGDFDAVSLYSYQGQSEDNTASDDFQSLLTPLPNGILTSLSASDGHILAMCPFTRKDGTYSGLFVGGNFTSLGGVHSEGVALFNTTSGAVKALSGLSGSVSALLCDQETNSVYVGGDFTYKNSSNAAAWVGTDGWSSLSFSGFNGPVTSILKADDGHIIFGGSFDGLGNSTSTSSQNNTQIINLQNATISSDANSTTTGYSSPRNIICSTGEDGEGDTWLLTDYSPGYWRAEMGFVYEPTKLRLYNTHVDGRGTKSFLFRRLPDDGIMNLTYTDPDSGDEVSCDASCPLSNSTTELYRDFTFVNVVGMSGFQIEVQDWYGEGAGLNGIELFEKNIDAYAIDSFNEPTCAGLDYPSRSTRTGSWSVTPSGSSQSEYLSAQVTDSNATTSSVTFEASIKESGNYTVLLYTPGCVGDATCSSRGIVNVTGTFATSTDSSEGSIQTVVYQTNDYEKYDTIYSGYVDASSSSFRSSITLAPISGQGDNITVVASQVRFELLSSSSSSGGLNGLYEYVPGSSNSTTDSAIDDAGNQLDTGASITSLASYNGVIYAGGNFSDSSLKNIMYCNDGNATSMPSGGLNDEVTTMLVEGDYLYVGGSFTDTDDGGNDDLQHVAAYSFSSQSWTVLGAGVNGRVNTILSLPSNISADINETTIAVSGNFDKIYAFGNNTAVAVSGFAVWVPSQKNWLQNLNVSQMEIDGELSALASVTNTTILAGNLESGGLAASDAVSLYSSDDLVLESLSVQVNTTVSGSSIYAGKFDTSSGRNLTILGGHFDATASNGSSISNILVLNSTDQTVIGLGTDIDSNSTFLTLAVVGDTLYAGGNVTGTAGTSTLNGFVTYNLVNHKISDSQPAPLNGGNVSVTSIAPRPDSTEIYFGGNFDAAGSLPCPSVCYWDTSEGQWNRPGTGLTGTILALDWISSKELMAVGNLSVSDNNTAVAIYNTKKQTWSPLSGAAYADVPGTITAFTPANEAVSEFWLAGQATNGSNFLLYYGGSALQAVENTFEDGTVIQSLQVLVTSTTHESSSLLEKDEILLVTGSLVLPDFGNASSAVFNGTAFSPFILTTAADGTPGSVSQLFTEKQNTYTSSGHHLSNGIVVLISFCLALACIFLIVISGVILNKVQRRRQGYMAAPQASGTDRPSAMRRVPPEYLFNTLSQRNPGAPVL